MEERIYIIVAKMLHGEASDEERMELNAWLAEDPGHRDLYAGMETAWKNADSIFDVPKFDTASAWERVAVRMQPKQNVPLQKGRSFAIPDWTKYSAAIAAVLLIAFIIWAPFRSHEISIVAEAGDQQVELPDHTKVYVRKGSTISYPTKFAGNERRITLQGEAYFEVTRNEAQPFIIDAQSVDVKVLGTTFNVRCTPAVADVTVTSGRVQVSAQKAGEKSVVLLPGKKAHYEGGALEESNSNGFESLWKNPELTFTNQPLSEVFRALTILKDSSIQTDNRFTAQQLSQEVTATFRNQSLEDMLTELCLITNCRWERRGAGYFVQSK